MHREFEIFRDEFARFFQPMIAGAADSSAAKSLLYNLGYVPPPQFRVLENFRANIDAVRTVIKDMSELTDEQIENNPELIITNAKNAVEALQALFNNLKNVSALLEAELAGSELLEQTDILETLPRKLFDYLTIEYLREYFWLSRNSRG